MATGHDAGLLVIAIIATVNAVTAVVLALLQTAVVLSRLGVI